GDGRSLLFPSFRLVLVALVPPAVRPRLRFRFGWFGMVLPRLDLRLVAALLALALLGLSVSIPPLSVLLVALRLGVRLVGDAAAAAPISAFAGFEFELRDALDVDARNLAPDQPDDGVDIFFLMRRGQREGAALAPGAAGPADAVHIVFRMQRDVEVEYMGKADDVEAAGGHVARHQDRHIPAAELVQRLRALGLGHIAVQCRDVHPMALERAE